MTTTRMTQEEGRAVRKQLWGPALAAEFKSVQELLDTLSFAINRAEVSIEDHGYGAIYQLREARKLMERALFRINESAEQGR